MNILRRVYFLLPPSNHRIANIPNDVVFKIKNSSIILKLNNDKKFTFSLLFCMLDAGSEGKVINVITHFVK